MVVEDERAVAQQGPALAGVLGDAGPRGQSDPSEPEWLRAGMADMDAMHESCT
jgi:hypothetical protein